MTMTNAITFDPTQRESQLREAFQHALDERGIALNSSKSFERAFARALEAADHSNQVSAERLAEIVDDVVSGMEVFQGVADSYR